MSTTAHRVGLITELYIFLNSTEARAGQMHSLFFSTLISS